MAHTPTRDRIKSEQINTTPLRRPDWIKVRAPSGETYEWLQDLMHRKELHTVCEEARCPNVGECWKGDHATMTLMVLGDECTRRCRFCAVKTVEHAAPPDPATGGAATGTVDGAVRVALALQHPSEPRIDAAGLARLSRLEKLIAGDGHCAPAPVERWNPPYCGDIGLSIARDGTWAYRGSPINRPALVKLFASVLRVPLPRGWLGW